MNIFKNKNILITGGTGSIGSEILRHLLLLGPKTIKIFSRDEYKHYKLKYQHQDKNNIEYIIGDVRDLESLSYACREVDILFHAAALKHVPFSEERPEEFIKTNVLGSINVEKAAETNKIPLVVSISSDKSVNPSNVMGLTKALQEKIFASSYLQSAKSTTSAISVRFGNVIGTKGSIFPIIYHQVMNNKPITITHPEMTRFFMSKREAIDLIFWATKNASDGAVVTRKMKSIKIFDLVRVFLKVLGKEKNYPVQRIGIRVGEKMHEALITEDELYRIREKDMYYVIFPYSKFQIKENILEERAKNSPKNIKQFYSNHKENFLGDKEIVEYIRDFLREQNTSNEFI